MKKPFTLPKQIIFALAVLLICISVTKSFSQVIVYTNDTGGVLNSVAAHITADTLKRVNGAARLSTPCTHGFSTRGFTNASTYSDTTKAVQITVAPNSGYHLKIDSFKADLRSSTTGPGKARFAYSLDGGTTWTDQGTDQTPNNSTNCDSTVTCRWSHTVLVNYPGNLMFRIYGFNASVSTGTGNMQLLNLIISGSTIITTMVPEIGFDENSFTISPNPIRQNATISYHLNHDETVSLKVYNVIGQLVKDLAGAESQAGGTKNYSLSAIEPGIYFVKLTVGNSSYLKKIIKL